MAELEQKVAESICLWLGYGRRRCDSLDKAHGLTFLLCASPPHWSGWVSLGPPKTFCHHAFPCNKQQAILSLSGLSHHLSKRYT